MSLKFSKNICKFGPGGRSSNSGLTVTVFGGHGFVGRYFLTELGACGTRTYVPFRGDELDVRHIKPMFDLGQLGLLPYSIRDKESIRESMKNSDIVVNMIGKYYETKHVVPTRREDGKLSRVNYPFEEIHVEATRNIASIAKELGISQFIQVSALSADLNSPSRWCKSKAVGEQIVKDILPESVIVKLAPVFGPEDRLLNWIAEANSRLPFFPLLNNGSHLLQPVYVGDIGKGLLEISKNYEDYRGKSFQFVGPAEYSYKELTEFVQDVTLRRIPLVDVPLPAARLAGKWAEELISPVLTEDLVIQMQEDIIAKEDQNLLQLEDLGIEPVSLDRIAFDYLHRFRAGGHFTLVEGYH